MGLNNGPNLEQLFNQRFGANAYQNGLNMAADAGQTVFNSRLQAAIDAITKQQAAKQAAAQAALQKPITDLKNAADYWKDPTNNAMLHQKGAWRVVQDLQNDPEMQAQLKAQGYDPKAIADEAYNVATDGQIKSAAGFKQFYNDVSPDAATRKANQQSIQDVIDSDAAQAAQAKQDAINKQNYNNSWYGKLLNGIGSGISSAGNAIGGAVGEVGKNIGNEYNKVVNDPKGLGDGLYNAGNDFFNSLNELGNRVDDQTAATLLGQNVVNKEHQQQQSLLNQLKANPQTAQLAQTNQNIFNQSNSQAKTRLDKLANLTGGFAGNVAPYLVGDGLLGAVSKIGKVGEFANSLDPFVQKLAGGALSGGVGAALDSGAKAAVGNNQSAGDVMKNILESAGMGAGGNLVLGGGLKDLLGQLNLKGQATKLMQDTGSIPYNENVFSQALKEANTPTGDVSNVLADKKPMMPQPFDQRYNLQPQTPTVQPTDVSNNNWFSSSAMQDHPMLNFTQQGANMPQARGILQDTSAPKAQSGTISDIANQALNKANTFSNAPAEGFNQRLLNVQQEMKGLQNKTQAIANNLPGSHVMNVSYKPDVESLYQQVRQPNDPKTFDDLIKAAEMEHNVQNPSLTTMLKSDPNIQAALDKLNALGKPSRQAPTSKLVPEVAPPKTKVNIPVVKGPKAPHDLLQDFKVSGGKTTSKNNSGLINQLKVTKGGKLNIGEVLNSLAEQKNYILNSVKTDKNISKMSKEELTNVANKLEKQHELVSKSGNSEKLKSIEEDMAKVKQAGLKLDLQFFGAHAKANPIEAVREKIFGKVPEKTPQDIAKEKAQVYSAVKKLEEKGVNASAKEVEAIRNMKDIKPWQTQTLTTEELLNKLPTETRDRLMKIYDEGKAGHVDNYTKRRDDLYNKVVKELGIKKGSKESALVQDYGEKTLGKKALEKQGIDPEKVSKEELNKINESELNRLAGSKADDIRKADKYIQDEYAQQIKEVNAVKAQIYHNQPDKLVPVREDYYHHFNELHGFDSFKNVLERNHGIDPHLAGISQDTKPKTKWAAPWQKRGNGEYKSDAVGGMLRYLGASSYATHIDPIAAALRNYADHFATASEGLKSEFNVKTALNRRADELTGKTHVWDRAIQEAVGRKTWNIVNTVNSHIKKNKILGNVGSVLGVAGNMPAVVGVTKQYAAKALPAAIKDFASAVFNHGHLEGPAAESKFLKERYMGEGNNKFETRPLKKMENNAALMIEAGDKAAAFLAWHGSYQQALAKKLTGNAAVEFADKQARHLMAGRGIGERPLYQTSKITHLVAPFSLEVGQLWKILGKQFKSNDYAGLATFAVGAAVYNHVMQEMRGSGTGYDPLGAGIEGWNDNKNMTTADKVHGAWSNVLGETLGEIPGASNLIKTLGLDQSATKKFLFGNKSPDRFGSGTGAITDIRKPFLDAIQNHDLNQTILDTLPLIMPFGGSQAAKTTKGVEALTKGGAYNKNGQLEYPINTSNPTEIARALMFGPNSTGSGQQYFNEHQTALSKKEMTQYQDGSRSYDSIMQQRAQNAFKTQISKVRNDKTLSPEQKLQQIALIMQKMQQGK